MRNATIDIALILIVFLIAYMRPCVMTSFFNTMVGRVILLLAIVLLSTANTLWGILGVIVLVSFREQNMTEGLENIADGDEKKAPLGSSPNVQSANTSAPDPKASGRGNNNTKPMSVKPEDWRKENCKADQVMLDGEVISMDDFASKFPNVSFLSGKCNPCMADCQIKVTAAAARLDAEDKVKSKPSNSMPTSSN